MNWYKVIILKIDVFESTILNEKHFGSKVDAENYITSLNPDTVGVMVTMG